jgi:hypothetical protein
MSSSNEVQGKGAINGRYELYFSYEYIAGLNICKGIFY